MTLENFNKKQDKSWDLFFGLALPNTPKYRVSKKVKSFLRKNNKLLSEDILTKIKEQQSKGYFPKDIVENIISELKV